MRALHPVYTLTLRPVSNVHLTRRAVVVSEHAFTPRILLGLLASEFIQLILTIYSVWRYAAVTGLIFLAPLAIKIIMALVTVRRESLTVEGFFDSADATSSPTAKIFELEDANLGFVVIVSPEAQVRQFFQHYGHPKRNAISTDRLLEALNITGLALTALLYPATIGFFSYQMKYNSTAATVSLSDIWLAYQAFAILAALIAQITSLSTSNRTEACVARALAPKNGKTGGQVILMGPGFLGVEASLGVDVAAGVAEGRQVVQEIIRQYNEKRGKTFLAQNFDIVVG